MKKYLSLFLVFITLTHAEDRFFDTSYDCTKTTQGSAERLTCTDEQLAKLDKELSAIYSSFYYVTNEIKSDQRAWMKQKNQCKNTVCIQKVYESRIVDLNASLTNEKTFPKYILDAMKESETKMQVEWDSIDKKDINGSSKFKAELIQIIKKYNQEGLLFKSELFRFKNIQYKDPLIEDVSYSNSRLKEILGECYKFQFYKGIDEVYPRRNYMERYYENDDTSEERKKRVDFTVWHVKVKTNEWLFLRVLDTKIPKEYGETTYLVSNGICEKVDKRSTYDLAKALNTGEIKKDSGQAVDYPVIVNYKDKEYIFDVFLNGDSGISFSLLELLDTKKTDDHASLLPFTIRFTSIKEKGEK
jgi:uncharacterized protein